MNYDICMSAQQDVVFGDSKEKRDQVTFANTLSTRQSDNTKCQNQPHKCFHLSEINILPRSLVRMHLGSKNLGCIAVCLSDHDVPN